MRLNLHAVASGILLLIGLSGPAGAQVRPQLPEHIDENVLSTIPGTTLWLAKTTGDAGRADSNLAMNRMLLLLKSTPTQSAALDRLIAAQHDPASPLYHQWLSSRQFGARFGSAQDDVNAIVGWLQSKGFHVNGVANGRRSIEFSGAAGQVERAFHTEMHYYVVGGVRHLANSTDISIPSSLAGIVAGVESLNDFHAVTLHRVVALPASSQGISRPFFDVGGINAIAPGDFATIYNVAPLYSAGVDGTGQTVAVVGRSNFNMSDVSTFRSMFGLAAVDPQIILNGPDPGILNEDEEVEALLDVSWSGAVARNATIDFVLSASTNTTGGEALSAQYIVDNNVAPVLSTSFGLCEALMGSQNEFYNSLWQQAAAEGISVVAAAGDSGSAGCDVPGSTNPASQGFAVSGIASTPYNTAIGGTQLNENGAASTYWSASNSSTNSSALSYIPEIVWNDSVYAGAGNSSNNLYAGAGGISTLYATPSWQTGTGVPSVDPNTTSQHHRYVPDLAFSAASHDPYVLVLNGGLIGVGGTSVGAPTFAGILALLNQHGSASVGNPAATLYSLASQYPSAFHDVVTGTNAVPCTNGSPNCTPGASGVGTMAGWSAGNGYDLATGLGSVNAYNMVMNWPASITAPAITFLAPNPMTGSASGQTLTINGTGFQNGTGLEVQLTSSAGVVTTLSGSQVSYVSSSQLQLSITPGTTATTFAVRVVNPGGSTSAPLSLSVSAPAQQPTSTAFVTGYALSGQTLRDNFTGWVGMKLTVGTNTLTVSSLGRICVANNTEIHTVKFVNASTGSDIAGASASVNMAGCTAGRFVYASISPVTLSAGTTYYLVTSETQGGDYWYDQGGVSTTTDATIASSIYSWNGSWYSGSSGASYVPPNFQYSTGSATTPQYLLTTNVLPAGSGSVSASPLSAGGSYTAGTVVTLTATPAANCIFVSWSGSLTGSANPISITMSGPQTVTANFQCTTTTASSSAFVTGYGLSGQALRDDFTGWVGMKLTVGANAITVSSLGRICVANNKETHTVSFVNASTGGDVTGASASVNMAGCTAGQFVYAPVSPVTLSAGTTYYLVSSETQGGDYWYDQGALATTTDATIDSAIYSWNGGWSSGVVGNSYVPPNFQYSIGGATTPQYLLTSNVLPAGSGSVTANPSAPGGSYASGTVVTLTATPAANCVFVSWSGSLSGSANPMSITMSGPQTMTASFQCTTTAASSTAFVTGYGVSGQALRDNFTGWVGMKLTVGTNTLTVSSLGRICVANNTQTHTVKFVNASTGSDVAGASASVNMAGCTAGQFVYASISPVTLSAGTTYYLVSSETQGGDFWYDQGAVSTATDATIISSIYSWNGSWYSGSANASYVPPNFLYSLI